MIYGLFSFICVTVLINTLIAMMEETIDTIDDRADVEWKFARSRLYMEYIRDGRRSLDTELVLVSRRASIRSGNTLPVPLNICPTPKSLVYQVKRLKRMLFTDKALADELERANRNNDDDIAGLNIRRANEAANSKSTQHENFRRENIFNRQRSYVVHEQLTYRIVIERIVKRFLLYYKNKHIGLDETNDRMEIMQLKNDISSLGFELFHEMDDLNEMRTTLTQQMKTLDDNLREQFDIEQMKQQLHEMNQ